MFLYLFILIMAKAFISWLFGSSGIESKLSEIKSDLEKEREIMVEIKDHLYENNKILKDIRTYILKNNKL